MSNPSSFGELESDILNMDKIISHGLTAVNLELLNPLENRQ